MHSFDVKNCSGLVPEFSSFPLCPCVARQTNNAQQAQTDKPDLQTHPFLFLFIVIIIFFSIELYQCQQQTLCAATPQRYFSRKQTHVHQSFSHLVSFHRGWLALYPRKGLAFLLPLRRFWLFPGDHYTQDSLVGRVGGRWHRLHFPPLSNLAARMDLCHFPERGLHGSHLHVDAGVLLAGGTKGNQK